MNLKIYLQENGECKLFEGEIQAELDKRNIVIGSGASIGLGASIGSYASIGSCASIGSYAIIGSGASIGSVASIGSGASIGSYASIKINADIIVMGPLGSRNSPMTAYRHDKTIWIGTGCFLGSIDDFAAAVKKKHAGNQHEKEYMAALDYCRVKFAIK